MKYKNSVLIIAAFFMLFGCKKEWQTHFDSTPVSSNLDLWTAIQADKDLTQFVSFVKDYHYDTLFNSQNTYTIFAPSNAAFTRFLANDTFGRSLLNYQIVKSFIQSGTITTPRKVQTLSNKFALFVNVNGTLNVDGIPVVSESPAYKNGKYFKLDTLDPPRPNFYQYFALTNPLLKKYIDSKDSIILDKSLSKPIGFDSQGNTIYDTVSILFNKFEYEYYPVRHEFRDQFATFVFPKEADYDAALTFVAQSLNLPSYHDYNDIPLSWQNKILIPYLLEHGVFPNLVEESEFTIPTSYDTVRLKNILGDSVVIDYTPAEKYVCSNGYAYNYKSFRVPDTLYAAKIKFEPEKLMSNLGVGKYAWKPDVQVTSTQTFPPVKDYGATFSNDTAIRVNFPKGYTGTFTLTFNVDNLFPRKYVMEVKTLTTLGGIYNVYVNGLKVITAFDYSYYLLHSNSYISVTGKKYKTVNGYNIFDCFVSNLTEYGNAQITFEYVGPGTVSGNGLSIDYIGFKPW